ncbi:efflux transporter outer membrane subunit [Sphingomonas tabacisoli]|uniref:Efflux transporter outer membrane subunit n=1 Tax=Sphingomonas tabacisoli TaxID=2249466 RepID=A0ABW4I3P6_9SPHN
MRSICAIAILSLLSGCAAGQLPAPKIDVPRRFEAAPGAAVSDDSSARWWALFDDEQLTTLVELALKSAPDARTAMARLREAKAVRRGALTSYDPQGNPGASVSHSRTSVSGLPESQSELQSTGASTSAGASFNPSWEIDLFGRRAAARQAADADLVAARFEYEASRLSLAAEVATQLIGSRNLSAQIVEAEETLRIARELARVGRVRSDAGLGSESDAARLDTQLANSQAELTSLKAQFLVGRRNLLVLLGQGSQSLDSLLIGPNLPDPPRPPVTTPAEVMARRPDVREAEARLRSAAGNLRLDELALFPRLTFQPGASITKILQPQSYVQSLWSLGAGLVVPLLDRPRLLSQIDAQTARGEQAVIEYERAVQAAYGEAENVLTRISADFERLDQLKRAEVRARFAFEAQQRGFSAGVVDLDALLQTEQAWRAARIALVTQRASTLSDAIAGFKALGGGWNPTGALEN